MAVIKISSRACLESNATRHCSTDAQERTVSKLERLAQKLGVPLRFGTLVGKYPQTVILDYKYQDSAVSVSSNGSFEINGEEFGSYDSYFSFSRVNIDDVKDALLSLKAEAGEEESLNESDDVWSTPESAAKSLFDRGLVASDYVERACKRHGKDQDFAYEVGVIISQMCEEDEHLGESKSINEDARNKNSHKYFALMSYDFDPESGPDADSFNVIDIGQFSSKKEAEDNWRDILSEDKWTYVTEISEDEYNDRQELIKFYNEHPGYMDYEYYADKGFAQESFSTKNVAKSKSIKESLHESKSEFTEVIDVLESFGDLLEPDDISPDNITGTFNEEDLSKIKKKLKSLGFKYDSDRASFFSKDRFFEITLDGGEFEINEIFDEEDSEDEFLGESLHESKDIYSDSQIRYELEQVLDYLENSAGAFKKILSRNRWNETATDSLVDDMKDCFNRVKKIAYSLDPDRYSMFDGR